MPVTQPLSGALSTPKPSDSCSSLTTHITSCCTCGPNSWNLKSELLRECFFHFTPLHTLIFLHAFVFILPSRRCLLDAYYKLLGLTCKPSKICTSSYHLAAAFCMSSATARVSYILIHWMGISILYILYYYDHSHFTKGDRGEHKVICKASHIPREWQSRALNPCSLPLELCRFHNLTLEWIPPV